MIKSGQKRKTLYINVIDYIQPQHKFTFKTIKKSYYVIDCRDDRNGYYGFHDSSWAVDEYEWLFTEEDLDKIKDYDSETIYILYSERPYSKEELQDKIKDHLENRIQKYTNRINYIINKIYEAE